MFWWFERAGQFTRCEITESSDGGYELRLVEPSGAEHVERFDSPSELAARQQAVEAQLRTAGWSGPHAWIL